MRMISSLIVLVVPPVTGVVVVPVEAVELPGKENALAEPPVDAVDDAPSSWPIVFARNWLARLAPKGNRLEMDMSGTPSGGSNAVMGSRIRAVTPAARSRRFHG
jgi:hypothetical protein